MQRSGGGGLAKNAGVFVFPRSPSVRLRKLISHRIVGAFDVWSHSESREVGQAENAKLSMNIAFCPVLMICC
jgi:hypothetical protein